jgi:Rad3-related DNA helicase
MKAKYPWLTSMILSSRSSLCVNSRVINVSKMDNTPQLDVLCNSARAYDGLDVDTKGCIFDRKLTDTPALSSSVHSMIDTTEMVKQACQNLEICPYVSGLQAVKTAHIVLLPYSYLASPSVRASQTNMNLENSVIFFDEGRFYLSLSWSLTLFSFNI